MSRHDPDHPDRVPTYTVGGRWHIDEDPWAPTWTGGFLAGLVLFAVGVMNLAWVAGISILVLLEKLAPGRRIHLISFEKPADWADAARCEAMRERLAKAGVETIEARISHLAYAPEIAAAMLQRVGYASARAVT